MTIAPPDLSAIADRHAITDVIYRYCRAMDRMDRDLALSCWHPGGTDDHAPLYVGSAAGFIDYIFPAHALMLTTRHVVANILIELDGDCAGTESYWLVTHRIAKGEEVFDVQAAGRYVDRFERLGGLWAIRHRHSIRDWSRMDPVAGQATGSQLQPLVRPNNPGALETLSRRDRRDYSYRVLTQSAS